MTKLYEKMLFNNYDDFFIKRQFLKSAYVLLSLNEKRKYKEHIYTLEIKEFMKDKIWEYFNEPMISPYYVFDGELKKIKELYDKNKNNVRL